MSEVLFKSKRPKLSPARQALADAIQNLSALEAQFASLDAATNWNGAAEVRVRKAEDAVLKASEQLQRIIEEDADQVAGGPVPVMTPRHAREAVLRAQDEVRDAKAAKERTEQRYLAIKPEIVSAQLKRDAAHEAVLREQADQLPALLIEVEGLQTELAAKGQLLEALAGSAGLFNARGNDAVSNWMVAPISWTITRHPLPPLALYRDAAERLKHDATVELPRLSPSITDEHLSPRPEVEHVAAPTTQFRPTLKPGFLPERLPTPERKEAAPRHAGHNEAMHAGMPINGDLSGQQSPIRTGALGSKVSANEGLRSAPPRVEQVQSDDPFEAQRNPIRTGPVGGGLMQRSVSAGVPNQVAPSNERR